MKIADKIGVGEQLQTFIFNTFPRARQQEVVPRTQLLEEGIVDSLGLLEIISFIEDQFECTVADDEVIASNFSSIKSLTEYVENKLS